MEEPGLAEGTEIGLFIIRKRIQLYDISKDFECTMINAEGNAQTNLNHPYLIRPLNDQNHLIENPTLADGTEIGLFIIGPLTYHSEISEIYVCTLINEETKGIAKLIKNSHSSEINAEGNALTNLNHPYLISPLDIQKLENDDVIFFFKNFVEGDLEQVISDRFNDPQITYQQEDIINWEAFLARFFYLIAEGLSYMHNSGFVHNKILPENILLHVKERKDGSYYYFPVIIDFVESAQIDPNDSSTNTQKDVLFYGLTLFYCMTGFIPYSLDPKILQRCLDFLQKKGISNSFSDFICGVLTQRPSFDELINHSWFNEFYPEEERELDN